MHSFIQPSNVKVYDPCKLSWEESCELNQLLCACDYHKDFGIGRQIFLNEPTSRQIHGHVFYEIPIFSSYLNGKKTYFQLKNCSAILFSSNLGNKSYGFNWKIVGPKLHHGGFGEIYSDLGKLVPQPDGSLIREKTKKIYKKELTDEKFENVFRHDDVSIEVGHLHCQTPIIQKINGDYISFRTMKRSPGRSLFALKKDVKPKDINITECNSSYKYKNFLSLLNLALNILYAAQEEIVDYEVVHADIKPENLIVGKKIFFIDYDLGKLVNTTANRVPGTKGFIAPEVYLTGNPTEQSDVYSLGITLGELFGIVIFPKNLDERAKFLLKIEDEEYKKRVQSLLEMMTEPNPDFRCSLKSALQTLEIIHFDWQNKKYESNINLKTFISDAFVHGRELRKKLDASVCANRKSKKSRINLLNQLTQLLPYYLPSSDQPEVLSYFVNTLRIDEFRNLNSREEIMAKTKAIRSAYISKVSYFQQLWSNFNTLRLNLAVRAYFREDDMDEATYANLNKLADSSSYLFSFFNIVKARRGTRYIATIDNIVKFTAKMDKDILKLETQIKCMENAIQNNFSSDSIQTMYAPINRASIAIKAQGSQSFKSTPRIFQQAAVSENVSKKPIIIDAYSRFTQPPNTYSRKKRPL